MLRPGKKAILAAFGAALGAAALATPSAGAAAPAGPRVLLALLPQHEYPAYSVRPIYSKSQTPPTPTEAVLNEIAARKQFALGIVSATQGGYTAQQTVLDITQGTRTSQVLYNPLNPPNFALTRRGAGGFIRRWGEILKRVKGVPQTVKPGLLSQSVPGGAGYVGITGVSTLDATIAADRRGDVAQVSIGPAASVASRAQAMLASRRFVVANLPPDAAGASEMDALLRARAPDELLMVMQTPPDVRGHQLLPLGIAGLGAPKSLTSQSTHLDGLVAAIDIAPTVLHHLGVKVPNDILGQRVTLHGKRDAKRLDDLRKRFNVIGKRRLPTLYVMLLFWAGVFLALGTFGQFERAKRTALRIGALAFMWTPLTVLLGGTLNPSKSILEIVSITLGSFLLAAITDRLVPWPRGPLLPAVVVPLALTAFLAARSDLVVRSALGPNPSYGSRFFGIGNELKSGLTVLVLAGVAAALAGQPRSRRNAAIFAGAGLVLGVMLGAGRLGAGVGAVIIVAAAFSVATLMMLPGGPSKRAIAIAILSPLAALGALAAIDLVTSGGGHLTNDVLKSHHGSNLGDIIRRRGELAGRALLKGRMPVMVLALGLAVAFGWRHRWLYDPMPGPALRAALLGGVAAGIVGTIAEDSGPLLFVVAVFVLGFLTAYVQGDPRLAEPRAGPAPPAGVEPAEPPAQPAGVAVG